MVQTTMVSLGWYGQGFCLFSFYLEFTRRTTFLVMSGSTFPNDRIATDGPFVNFVQQA